MMLHCLPTTTERTFWTPVKKINDGEDLQFFHTTEGYRDLLTWLAQLNRSVFPVKDSEGKITPISLDKPPTYSPSIQNLRSLISDLTDLIDKAPPDAGPRRFGNVAFRTWFKLVDDGVDALLDLHIAAILDRYEQPRRDALRDEIKVYLLGSFGSAQRLDYGTGHELSFLAFLGCLWKVHGFEVADVEKGPIVMGVIQPYLELIRCLVLTYTLEPAGSHGVWGLDDHSFLPYIFGSAQLAPPIDPSLQPPQPTPTEGSLPSAPSTSAVVDKERVAVYRHSNMYFDAIQFVYDVKRGPFWEHSPVLYDISGVKGGWGKVNKGLVKMWVAEVVGKFPVVQHFPFGSLFKWETDPDARGEGSNVHANEQPKKAGGPPAASVAGGAGTKAPWAVSPAGGQMATSSTGAMPSTRAPWAAAGRQKQVPAGPAGTSCTTAPWAATQRPVPPCGASGSVPAATDPAASRTRPPNDPSDNQAEQHTRR